MRMINEIERTRDGVNWDCEDCKEQDLHCEDCSMYEYDKDRMSN